MKGQKVKISTESVYFQVKTEQEHHIAALETELRRWFPQCQMCMGSGRIPAQKNTFGPCHNCAEARRLVGVGV